MDSRIKIEKKKGNTPIDDHLTQKSTAKVQKKAKENESLRRARFELASPAL